MHSLENVIRGKKLVEHIVHISMTLTFTFELMQIQILCYRICIQHRGMFNPKSLKIKISMISEYIGLTCLECVHFILAKGKDFVFDIEKDKH